MPAQDTSAKKVYTLSIEKAIKRGKFVVRYTSLAILVLLILLSITIIVALGLPNFVLTIALTLGIALFFLYKSIAQTHWRIWAFTNVRNVHALKKYAQQEGLMPKDDIDPFRLAICTASQKRRWDALRARFLEDDIFIDDTSIKPETPIPYSGSLMTRSFILTLVLLVGGIYLTCLGGKSSGLGAFFCILSLLFIFLKFRELKDKSPKIVLSDRGIKTERLGFYEWHDVNDETVVRQTDGKYTHYYLSYTTPEGNEFLMIDDLAIKRKELVQLLIVYRGRFEKNNCSPYR